MADSEARGWSPLFNDRRAAQTGFANFFVLRRGNVSAGRVVEIDIERYGERLAPVVSTFKARTRVLIDQYTTKEFKPPIYKPSHPMDVEQLFKRDAGTDPFSAGTGGARQYARRLTSLATKALENGFDMVSRSAEFQAAQVMQSGTLSLTDETGQVTYEIDFRPKATHFFTVGTLWSDTVNADPIADLQTAVNLNRADGKVDSDVVIMGSNAISNFINNDSVKEKGDVLNFGNLITIEPRMQRIADKNFSVYGSVMVGTRRLTILTTDNGYEDFSTGVFTPYLDPDKVIVTSSQARFDMMASWIPRVTDRDPRIPAAVRGAMPPDNGLLRPADGTNGAFPVRINPIVSDSGDEIELEVAAMPLCVPTQIDGYTCMTTG